MGRKKSDPWHSVTPLGWKEPIGIRYARGKPWKARIKNLEFVVKEWEFGRGTELKSITTVLHGRIQLHADPKPFVETTAEPILKMIPWVPENPNRINYESSRPIFRGEVRYFGAEAAPYERWKWEEYGGVATNIGAPEFLDSGVPTEDRYFAGQWIYWKDMSLMFRRFLESSQVSPRQPERCTMQNDDFADLEFDTFFESKGGRTYQIGCEYIPNWKPNEFEIYQRKRDEARERGELPPRDDDDFDDEDWEFLNGLG